MPRRFKLKGPSEHARQVAILAYLGREQRVLKRTKQQGQRWVGTGIFIASDGSMFWRANAGAKVVEDKGNAYLFRANPAGTADILGVVRSRALGGVPVAIEVKDEEGVQSESQRAWQALWEAAGGVYIVARSPGEAMVAVDRVRREAA